MRLMLTEKRKFNWVVLGLLTATIIISAMRILDTGQLLSPF